ncbi:MAG: PQQ-dependent sugar dehydrogenase [Alcanivoracaceae bacterium]
MLLYRFTLIVASLLAISGCGVEEPLEAPVASEPALQVTTETVASGLAHPWGMAFLPKGEILVTERAGRVRRVIDGKLDASPIPGVPAVVAHGQGGMLDIALHPDFTNNRLVYLSYAAACPEGGKTTAVGRGSYRDGLLQRFTPVFISHACSTSGQHFGGRLLFDHQGYLYLTIGDRGDRYRAQNGRDHAGTVLRLHDDGRIPKDNPFVEDDDIDDAIWSYGHRNPQGIALHPDGRQIWLHEHGPRGGDEINQVLPGRNYGWPLVTFGREYYGPKIGATEMEGMEPPLKHWTPSIAPSGMAFYQGVVFPQWQGDLFVGALAGKHLARVRFDGLQEVEEEKLLEDMARIRDVRVGPDGFLYLLTDAPDGALLRLKP